MLLAKALVSELKNIGVPDVKLDEKGYVIAKIPSNMDKDVPTVGFIAHMDTSPEVSGKDVKPQIINNYDGGIIVLNKEKNISIDPIEFPEILRYKGNTIICTDGTTLLGADDKAGIAEIITAVEYLLENPVIKHGNINIAFTPDEEIGQGVDFFNVEDFNADFAYTVDGAGLGELEYENFNAAKAKLQLTAKIFTQDMQKIK